MEFTASQVWGAAAAADRINGGYCKEPVYQKDETGFPINMDKPVKQANKMLVKKWLRENDFSQITAADTAAGEAARNHFKSYTLLALTGQMNDFQTTAMKIAAKDVFTGRDMYDFAVVSCLPDVARRDQARTEVKREIYNSEQLVGAVGAAVVGDITVVSSKYNHNFDKYRITARMGEAFVDFWFGRNLEGTLRIKGKIKNVRGDKTTQLNYVKISG
jgi:hypothetical protein